MAAHLIADGESLASLGAAAFEDRPPPPVSHSFAETVLVAPPPVGRLVCWLHSLSIISLISSVYYSIYPPAPLRFIFTRLAEGTPLISNRLKYVYEGV